MARRVSVKHARPFPTLIVMAKSPRLGLAKRRLAREIGEAAAIRFYRACLHYTLLRLAAPHRWRTLLAVAPDSDMPSTIWPPGIARIAQGKGDLATRMQRLIAGTLPGEVILIGADVPRIEASHIAQAFHLLRQADAVLGPAEDGGFWLAGFRRRPALSVAFANVRWSSRHALADTLANLDGKRIALAATLADVDSGADYRRLHAGAERLVRPRS
jgi:uncharacterized protein